MDQLMKFIILGLIQGLTEWLPISSTGHLKIAEKALSLSLPISFDVILHLATLAVVILYFRGDIKHILSALIRLDFKTEHGRLIPLIIVGTAPTALLGLALNTMAEVIFQSVPTIALAFIVCGAVLYPSKVREEGENSIGYFEALAIGVAQGIAIIPGLSRSGLTIATALMLGVRREEAFKFSFLLSMPAVFGALALTLYTEYDKLALLDIGLTGIIVGGVTAFIMGYAALNLLWKAVTHKAFYLFAFYCWFVGCALASASLLGLF